MNFQMTDDLVGYHIRDIRRQATLGRSGAQVMGADRWPGLRSRIGIMLVEAGLHLLATTAPVRPD